VFIGNSWRRLFHFPAAGQGEPFCIPFEGAQTHLGIFLHHYLEAILNTLPINNAATTLHL